MSELKDVIVKYEEISMTIYEPPYPEFVRLFDYEKLQKKNKELRKKVIKECYDQFIYCVDDDEYVKWMNKELNTQEK